MHFAVLVVGGGVLLQAFFNLTVGNDNLSFGFGTYEQFQNVEEFACVAAAVAQHCGSFAHFDVALAQFAVFVEHAVEQSQQVVVVKRIEHIYLAARKQRADNFERRVFGCRSDKGYRAVLHGSEQGVLLRFREAVYFVDEKDGACRVEKALPPCALYYFAHVFNPACNGTQGVKRHFQLARYYLCKRCLAYSGRAPQDERTNAAAFEHAAQHAAFAYQMFLAHVAVERSRAHSLCQRSFHCVFVYRKITIKKQTLPFKANISPGLCQVFAYEGIMLSVQVNIKHAVGKPALL